MEKGNSDVEVFLLMFKKIEIQRKPFCFEFKENSKLQFHQISTGSFSISVPSNGISCFLGAINCFCEDGFSKEKEVNINDKVFCFKVEKRRSGHFLKVWDASASKNSSCIIIPSGDNCNNGWKLFRKTLAEIDKTSRVVFPPYQRSCCAPGEFADAKFDSIMSPSAQNSSELNVESLQNEIVNVEERDTVSCPSAQNSSVSQLNVESSQNENGSIEECDSITCPSAQSSTVSMRNVESSHNENGSVEECDSVMCPSAQNSSVSQLNVGSSHNENGSYTETKMIGAGSKRFYFDLRSTKRMGHFLRIAEVKYGYRKCILIPLSGIQRFHEMTSYFHKFVNESLSSTSMKQCTSHHESNDAQVEADVLAEYPSEFADAKSDSISSPDAQNSPGSQLNAEPAQNKNGSTIEKSKTMSTGTKSFYFDVWSHEKKGNFLKITQVMDRQHIYLILPLSVIHQFHETVGYFGKLSNESLANTSVKHRRKDSASGFLDAGASSTDVVVDGGVVADAVADEEEQGWQRVSIRRNVKRPSKFDDFVVG